MISLAALDKFATDHLLLEAKCATTPQPIKFSAPPADAEVSVALANIRQLVMEGSVNQATSIVQALCPDTLSDPEFQMEIRIHKLFELIHRTQVAQKENPQTHQSAVQQALECSKDLAEFALHAFPDAYTKFTQSMMLFACPDQDVSDSKLMKQRDVLAGNLCTLVRMAAGTGESRLSLLIRYLLAIYLQFGSPLKTNKDDFGIEDKIIHDLLPWQKSATCQSAGVSWSVDDASYVKRLGFEDYSIAEIQSLRERLNISRQQSVKTLQYARGDTLAALRNELGRLRINRGLLGQLVTDYCLARGLNGAEAVVTDNGDESAKISTCPVEVTNNSDLSATPNSSFQMVGYMRKLRILAKQVSDFEAFHVTSIQELLPVTSTRLKFRIGLRQTLCLLYNDEVGRSLQNCRENIAPLAQECQDLLPLLSDALLLTVYANDCKRIRSTADAESFPIDMEVSTVTRDLGEAAQSPRKSPTNHCSAFEKAIAGAHARVSQHSSVCEILGEAYELLAKEFGEPRLVKLLKHLLTAHQEWQARNLMEDRFAGKLGINNLLFGLRQGSACHETELRTQSISGAEGTEVRENVSAQVPRNEETILALMEIFAMTRTEAFSAVRNHPLGNDPQAMLEHVLNSMF